MCLRQLLGPKSGDRAPPPTARTVQTVIDQVS